MQPWQQTFIAIYGLYSFVGFLLAYYKCKYKKLTHTKVPSYWLNGSFVWSDQVVFGAFWALISIATILLQDWVLFLLVTSLFWAVRSWGEAVYWFNQQFSTVNRNPVKDYPTLKSIFHNDSFWWVFQIYWQCLLVVSIILSLYFGKLWLGSL